jgi:hypothetical protein
MASRTVGSPPVEARKRVLVSSPQARQTMFAASNRIVRLRETWAGGIFTASGYIRRFEIFCGQLGCSHTQPLFFPQSLFENVASAIMADVEPGFQPGGKNAATETIPSKPGRF